MKYPIAGARAGLSAVALIAGATALIQFGRRRCTRVRLAKLDKHASKLDEPEVVRFERLRSLPAPVERYFRNVLHDGQPMIVSATVRQQGEFRLKDSPDGWRPFVADQFFCALRPGFVWHARIRMVRSLAWPCVSVRDAYVNGRGAMGASIASLVPLLRAAAAPALDEGALQRYLAEAVWFPTALLPRPGLVWTAIDDGHALVTLEDGATRAALQVEFSPNDEIISIAAPRFRQVGRTYAATPWGGFYRNYVNRDGMRVPNDSEVYWTIDGSAQAYFKARNVGIRYRFAGLIERFIAVADIEEVHEVLVHAPADIVLDVARHFDVQSVPLVHAIFWLRERVLGSEPAPRTSRAFVDEMTALGWGKLAEFPGRALVMGAVTQPWRPDVRFAAIPPDRFASSSEPDQVKIVWTLEVESLDAARTRFRTQTRAVASDPAARRKFLRYWRRFGVGAVIIRRLLLRAIRHEAERQARNA